jgi:hypothetical protein
MTKRYSLPVVASIGKVDILTAGLDGKIPERAAGGHPQWTLTTHTMLDL